MFYGIINSQAYDKVPTIIFDGEKKKILFENANNTDLFINLKEMMPGDTREQNILLKINNLEENTKIFLEMENDTIEQLSNKLEITIYVNEKEPRKNGEYIELGTFMESEIINIKVKVKVSEEAGNELENMIQNFKWKILVQESNSDAIIEVPQTYDNYNIHLYVIISIISLIAILCLIRSLIKKQK